MAESRSNIVFQWVKSFFWGFLLYLFITTFLFSSYVVDGNSMQPSLSDRDRLIVSKISYELHTIKRFDIIVFHGINKQDYVKRVIGLPGDSIRYHNDELFINGRKYAEPYLDKQRHPLVGQKYTGDFTIKEATGRKKVPPNQLFTLGDNRLSSMDSRHFGFVPMKKVVGKVSARFWPVRDITARF
ncbi:signal peptidase I [Peribacillus deserti]|uniref:Signal peptidase I n=1 Tax=Peribacillus deserti TaxID=673318 RepID=A0ABS2QMR8_9BACI|nr:signal peptidase I [Peribacillus deserti]MBM7694009.1 signal peptidase I [Peribacillus deserti]